MQGEIDDMNVEMQRKESKINIIAAEKDKLESQLHEEEGLHISFYLLVFCLFVEFFFFCSLSTTFS